MATNPLVVKVNEALEGELGYKPFIATEGGGIKCASCHASYTGEELKEEFLMKTKVVKGPDGEDHKVHDCPKCKYTKGVNVHLRRRISELRQKLNMFEVNNGEYRNKYFTPGIYFFTTVPGDMNTLMKGSEAELVEVIQKVKQRDGIADDETVNTVSPPPVETPPANEPVVENNDEGGNEQVDEANDETATTEEDLGGEGEPTPEDGDGEEMSDEEKQLALEVEADDDEEIELKAVDEESSTESESPADNTSGPVNHFLGNAASASTPPSAKKKVAAKEPSYRNLGDDAVDRLGVREDPITAEMIRQNAERAAADVFKIGNVGKDKVYGIISKTRSELLREDYNSSNAKIVIDMILAKFEVFGRPIKNKLYIGDATHECPVVDFEGNIRLIFVDLDQSGGAYNVTAEINKRLHPTFRKDKGSRFRLMTFTIYSDMISSVESIRRVVKGVIKHIVHNLLITDMITPISIFHQSEHYFYTTAELDRAYIKQFIEKHSPGNVDKPSTDTVAIINSWENPEASEEDKKYRQVNVMKQLERNNEIDYYDLSMYMTCAMKYMCNEDTDGNICIIITDYIETLDLFIRDGFGACLGVVIHNARQKYPNRAMKVYFELDLSMIPSPTIHRYINDGNLKPIEPDFEARTFNIIGSIIAKDYGIKNIQELPVEGAEFLKPEYTKPFWRSIQKAPNFRSYFGDEKRLDWRRFTARNISRTLGEQMRGHTINVNDKSARSEVLEKLGYRHISQPKIDVLVVTNNLLNVCYNAVLGYENLIGCDGCFSLSKYVEASRSHVVGNDYSRHNMDMNPGFGYGGYYSNPNVPPWEQQYPYPMYGQQMDPMATIMQAYKSTQN